MPIVGFNFDHINVEKLSQITGKINIKNDIGIKNLEQEKLPIGKSEESLKFHFEYSLDYQPKIGNITLKGHILYLDEPKKIKEIMTGWKKNKKIPPDITEQILNTVLFKCNIKALALSQEVNLPPHIQMPRLRPGKRPEDYIG